MSRSKRRVSRVLISILAVCLLGGGVAAMWHGGAGKPAVAVLPVVAPSDPTSIQIVPAVQLNAAMSRSNPPAITMPAPADKYTIEFPDMSGPAGRARLTQAVTMAEARSTASSSGPATQPVAASTGHSPVGLSASTQPSFVRGLLGDFESAHVRQVALTPTGDGGSGNSDPMSRAKALADEGNLVDARAMLNDELIDGKLPDEQATAVKQQLSLWNQSLVFSPRPYADDPFASAVAVKSGDNMSKIASDHDVTWELLSRINAVTPQKMRAGSSLKVITGPFHAVVSKKAFTIDLYLGGPGGKGSMYVTSYGVGLGKDDSTPPGTWMVEPHKKIKNPTYYSPRGEGVIEAGDPKNPLGPFWIGLTGIDGQAVGQQSYGIHGTIDPTSIGKQSSMGCIRLHNEDVALVYEMLVEGKSLVIVTP